MADEHNSYVLEKWKTLPNNPNFEISDLGRVRSVDHMVTRESSAPYFRKGRILKLVKTKQGYLMLSVGKSNPLRTTMRSNVIGVHRLVMLAFVGPPPQNMEVCHNNGVKTDNRLVNLRYDTRRSNIRDRLHNFPVEDHAVVKLTPDDARFIVESVSDVVEAMIKTMAKRFDVTGTCIRRILAKRSWGWLE